MGGVRGGMEGVERKQRERIEGKRWRRSGKIGNRVKRVENV